MRPVEIESWALRILDRQRAGGRLEDSRVEAKAEWPADANKAARQLGGHCNALRGDDALWIIGLDEQRGVQAIQPEDFATWWPRVSAEFHGEVPAPTEIILDYYGSPVVALHFTTDRAPYLVRVEGGGRVEREVPWREGTAVRTATRADLLRLLVPMQRLPQVEVMGATSELFPRDEGAFHLYVRANLYLTVPIGSALVFPEHRCELTIRVADWGFTTEMELTLGTSSHNDAGFGRLGGASSPPSFRFVNSADDQLLVEGPGFATVYARADLPSSAFHLAGSHDMRVRATLRAVDLERSVVVDITMPGYEPAAPPRKGDSAYLWRYAR
jgi:hypothetical protein